MSRSESGDSSANLLFDPLRTANSAAERLAAKYGFLWLAKVFPDGPPSSLNKLPVRRIFIRADGSEETRSENLEAKDVLRPLKSGERIFEAGSNRSYLGSQMPVSFPPPDTFFLPSRSQHWSNSREDFMTISFSRRTRVYILLPTLSREPSWMRPLFFKHRDPYGVQVTLPVRWKLSGMWKTLFFAVGKLAEFRHQQLRVFKSKLVYAAGSVLTIGGMGAGVITDTMPLVAFHEEHSEQGEGFENSNRSSEKSSEGHFPLNLLFSSLVPKFPASFYNGSLLEFEPWLRQLVKSIRRNRLTEVRFLLEADLLRTPESSHLFQYDISHNLLPPEENLPNYSLLVELPSRTRNLEMLTLLISRGYCAMDYGALRILMFHFEEILRVYGGSRGFFLGYLLRHPNPLSIVSAFQTALRAEIRERQGKKATAALESALLAFSALSEKIMRRIEDNMRSTTGDIAEKLPKLTAVLDPRAPSATRNTDPSNSVMTISDVAPLRIAFADQDSAFMSQPMVEGYAQLAWIGEETLLERSQEDNHTLSFLNPDFLYVVTLNLGLCCPSTRAMNWTSKFWHTCVFSSQAFFNSPRGRWAMRLLSSIMFIVVYLEVVGAALPHWWNYTTSDDYYMINGPLNNPVSPYFDENGKLTERAQKSVINCALFMVFIAGNVVEAVQQIIFRYHGNVLGYVSNKTLQFFILCIDIFMLFLTLAFVLTLSRSARMVDPLEMLKFSMCWTALAPLVWGRILVTFVPLIKPLGPMLQTFRGMLVEVLIFAVPWLIITCGFSVSLQVIYQPLHLPGFESWTSIMFLLFKAFSDRFEWALLDAIDQVGLSDEFARVYHLYGIIIMIMYTILSTILLGNLLIAIITNRYKPELARAQFLLNFAETVDTHRWMCSENLLSSPYNLIPLFFFWLPAAKRKKVHPNSFFRFGLFPLDGFTPATPNHNFLPSGRHEIPHLIYLLTIHPLLMIFTFVLYTVQTPYTVWVFASFGHKSLLKQIDDLRKLSMRSRGPGSLTASQVLPSNASRGPSVSGRRKSSLGMSFFSSGGAMVEGELNQQTIDAEMAAFGGDLSNSTSEVKATPTSPLRMLWTSVRDAVVRVTSLFLFFILGAIMYTAIVGDLLVIFLPVSIWLASIAWSLYHIFAGAIYSLISSFVSILRFLFSLKSQGKVSPESLCAPLTNEDKKQIQIEKRLQAAALLSVAEIEQCITESFSEVCLDDMKRGQSGDEVARNWARQAEAQSQSRSGGETISNSGTERPSKSNLSSQDGLSGRHLQERASRLSRTSFK